MVLFGLSELLRTSNESTRLIIVELRARTFGFSCNYLIFMHFPFGDH